MNQIGTEKKICKNCKSVLDESEKFCRECGLEYIPEPVDQKEATGKKPKHKALLAVGLVIGLIIVLLLPTTVTVPYQRLETYQEQYTDTEAFQVQVPYDATEYYTEKEPYTETYTEQEPFTDTRNVQKDLVYNVANTVCAQRVPLVSDAKVTYTVKNLDTDGGYFTLWVGFTLPDGNKIGQQVSNYIYPSQSADFTYTANAQVANCPYNVVSIPTKTTTESFTNYRGVQKSRTEYTDVQKSRTVTKYRTETQNRDVVKTRPAQRYVPDFKQQQVLMYQRILGLYPKENTYDEQ